jgi:hypothetical protein
LQLFDGAGLVDAALTGNKIVGGVVGELVTVGTLEASHGLMRSESVCALARSLLARQQGKAQGADLAFSQPYQSHL